MRAVCSCHSDLKLNARQQQTLALLRAWVDKNGAHKLSSRLGRGGKEGVRILNQITYWMTVPAGSKKLSPVEWACHLAGVQSEPGKNISADLDDDLQDLLRRYDAGEVLTETALKATAEGRKLYARVKRRAGTSWKDVYTALLELRPGLAVRRFMRHLPPGHVLAADGKLIQFDSASKEALREAAIKLISEHHELGFGADLRGLQNSPEMRRLLSRLSQDGVELVPLIAEATGQSTEAITHKASGARAFKVHHHTKVRTLQSAVLKQHGLLRSWTEAMVDGCLAHFMGPGYAGKHCHDVPLEQLVPGLTYENAPYTGMRSPDVDILVKTEAGWHAVEVTYRNHLTRPGYATKLDWKLARLKQAGIPCTAIIPETGAVEKLAADLRALLGQLGAKPVPSRESLLDFLKRHDGGRVTKYDYAQAQARALELGIGTADEYRARCAEDPRFIANPNTAYVDEGWVDWGTFLATTRTASHYSRFEDAHRAALAAHLPSPAAYRKKHKTVDPRLPGQPQETYADKGWKGWDHFLGRDTREMPAGKTLTAAETARRLGMSLASLSHWQKRADAPLKAVGTLENKAGVARLAYLESDVMALVAQRAAAVKASYTELAALCAKHKIKNTAQYAEYSQRVADDSKMPVNPVSFFDNRAKRLRGSTPGFEELGGWYGLLGLERPELPSDAMTPHEVAVYAKVSPASVTHWRSTTPALQPHLELEYAPRGSSKLVYRRRDVVAFLAKRAKSKVSGR